MIDIRSRTTALAGGGLVVIGLLIYGIFSVRGHTQTQLSDLQRQMESLQSRNDHAFAQIEAEIATMGQKMGLNDEELKNARSLADQLRQEQASTAQRLRR